MKITRTPEPRTPGQLYLLDIRVDTREHREGCGVFVTSQRMVVPTDGTNEDALIAEFTEKFK